MISMIASELFPMTDIVRQRIQERLRTLGVSANSASENAGISRSTLAKFLKGDSKELRDSNLRAIAKVLKCDPAFLRGEIDTLVEDHQNAAGQDSLSARTISASPTSQLTKVNSTNDVPIVGIVEAGSFRPVDWFDDIDLGVILNGYNPRFPTERQFGFSVRGDSMDLAGIGDGDEIVCIDPYEAGVEITDGAFVIVENRLDGGHTRELTVKELAKHDDRWELLPRSSNPKHQPIVVPKGYDLSDGREIQIVGIVVSVVRHLPVKYSTRGGKPIAAIDTGMKGKSTMSRTTVAAAVLAASVAATPCLADESQKECRRIPLEQIPHNHDLVSKRAEKDDWRRQAMAPKPPITIKTKA